MHGHLVSLQKMLSLLDMPGLLDIHETIPVYMPHEYPCGI